MWDLKNVFCSCQYSGLLDNKHNIVFANNFRRLAEAQKHWVYYHVLWYLGYRAQCDREFFPYSCTECQRVLFIMVLLSIMQRAEIVHSRSHCFEIE